MGDNQSQETNFQCQPDQPDQSKTECELLSYFTQLINQRRDQSLLLSDLGALLPDHLRLAIRENGGLRTCVQKFPIFKVSGQPGRERVALVLSLSEPECVGTELAQEDTSSSVGLPHTMANMGAVDGAVSEKTAMGSVPALHPSGVQDCDDEDSDNDHTVVQLRGLPYRATENDVLMFLGPHVRNLKEEESVELLLSRDGRPSGFARVQFSCSAAARLACKDLHERVMNVEVDASNGPGTSGRTRYVEVFRYSEPSGKLRYKKSAQQGNGLQADAQGIDPALEAEAARITPDQIADEVRWYMAQDGKGELLLSMLGVALSPAARLYLKRNDRGVKRFLAQYPNEFVISGEKGRERITYMPIQSNQNIGSHSLVTQGNSKPLESDLFPVQELGTHDVSAGLHPPVKEFNLDMLDELSKSPAPLGSPDPIGNPGLSPFATPSCWGTPDLNTGFRLDLAAEIPPNPTAMGPLMQSVWAAQMQWPGEGFCLDAPFANAPLPPPPDPRVGDSATSTKVTPLYETQLVDPPMLRLRGLPYETTVQDVLTFFAHHNVADRVAMAHDAVQMMTKGNGKPSGNAIVQLRSISDAVVVQKVLHMQNMGVRYIEVLPHPSTSGRANAESSSEPSHGLGMSVLQPQPMQRPALQSALAPVPTGSTIYSDALLLSQLACAASMVQTPEHDFCRAFNGDFASSLPRELRV